MGKFIKKIDIDISKIKSISLMYTILITACFAVAILMLGGIGFNLSASMIVCVVLPVVIGSVASYFLVKLNKQKNLYLDIYEFGFSFDRKDVLFRELSSYSWSVASFKFLGIIPIKNYDKLELKSSNKNVYVDCAWLIDVKKEMSPICEQKIR